MKCPRCGTEYNSPFCPQCGFRAVPPVQQYQAPPPQYRQPPYLQPQYPPPKKKKMHGCLLAFIVCAGVSFLLVLSLVLIASNKLMAPNGSLGSFFMGIAIFCIPAFIVAGILFIIFAVLKKHRLVLGLLWAGFAGAFIVFSVIGTIISPAVSDTGSIPPVAISRQESLSVADNSIAEFTVNAEEEEYKQSCVELDYSDLLRNPEEHPGERYHITVKVVQVVDGFFRCYTDDGSGLWLENEFMLEDSRASEAENFIKGDIIEVWATYQGNETIVRALGDIEEEVPYLIVYFGDVVEPS